MEQVRKVAARIDLPVVATGGSDRHVDRKSVYSLSPLRSIWRTL